jgi:tRNA(Arg) A34 adenosine deaminase TadA
VDPSAKHKLLSLAQSLPFDPLCHTDFDSFPPKMNPAPNPEFMRKAIALATENVRSGAGGPFGAVIVRHGFLISEGANRVTAENDPTAHAEVCAIRAACRSLATFNLQGCEIYTSCEPCPMCLAAIYWARIDRIYYGNTSADAARAAFDDAFLYRELALPSPQRSIPSSILLREEAWESFQLWIDTPNKTPY